MTELVDPEDPAAGLAAVVALRRLADRLEDSQVERAMRSGWSWAEVAEVLGISEQNVRTNLHLARRRMKELLAPYLSEVNRER